MITANDIKKLREEVESIADKVWEETLNRKGVSDLCYAEDDLFEEVLYEFNDEFEKELKKFAKERGFYDIYIDDTYHIVIIVDEFAFDKIKFEHVLKEVC